MEIQDIFTEYPYLREEGYVENYDLDNCYSQKGEALSELDIAVALIRFEGHVGQCAKAVGRARQTVAGFIQRNAHLLSLQEDIRENFLDDIDALHRKVAKSGDVGTQRFYLTTLGADRGYVRPNQVELSGRGGGPIETKEMSAREKLASRLDSLAARNAEIGDTQQPE